MNIDEEYLETKVMTAPPHVLHQMVVDGAIRFANQAERALRKKDFSAAHLALGSSRGFILELITGLDPSKAPDLVDQLKGIFLFAYRKLVEADMSHNPQTVSDAIRVLRVHRDTWNELSQRLLTETQQSASPEQPIPGPHRLSWSG